MIINNYITLIVEEFDKLSNNNKIKFYRNFLNFFELIKNDFNFLKIITNLYAEKQKIITFVNSLLSDYNIHNMKDIIWAIIENKRGIYMVDIFKYSILKISKKTKFSFITIYSPFNLSIKQCEQISNIVKKNINKEVFYIFKLNKELIGGIKVIGENFIFDNSLFYRFNEFKNSELNNYE